MAHRAPPGNNRLSEIPPEIALLENLVELSLGNNLLVSHVVVFDIFLMFSLELFTLGTAKDAKVGYLVVASQPIPPHAIEPS